MIAIIDYGMGNLRSVHKALDAVGHRAVITRDARVIADASHLVLPGVGAFGDCMANLLRYDLTYPIVRAIRSGKPFLGICLGLQLLFTESNEFGFHKGLDVIPGRVTRFPSSAGSSKSVAADLKIPHIGWNRIEITRPAPIFSGVSSGVYCYFVHSYFVTPEDAGLAASYTEYGISFVSSIWKDNVVACQFHPEKSQRVGLQLLKNFGDWQ
ncbi:imidazole glycerol phosphate synthase subunit HisH [Nitrospira sp. Nam80]